jgi:hypothetical protein
MPSLGDRFGWFRPNIWGSCEGKDRSSREEEGHPLGSGRHSHESLQRQEKRKNQPNQISKYNCDFLIEYSIGYNNKNHIDIYQILLIIGTVTDNWWSWERKSVPRSFTFLLKFFK